MSVSGEVVYQYQEKGVFQRYCGYDNMLEDSTYRPLPWLPYADPSRRYCKSPDSSLFNAAPFRMAVSGRAVHPHDYQYEENGAPRGCFGDVLRLRRDSMYADPVRRYFKNFDSSQFNAVPSEIAVPREVVYSHYYLYEENGEPHEY